MIRRKVLVLVFIIPLFSCSSVSKQISNQQKDFSLVGVGQHLAPGLLTQDDAVHLLGKPDLIVPMIKQLGIAWAYFDEEKYDTRVSFIFDHHSNLLETNWFTKPTDPESDLKIALSRFPSAHFIRSRVRWTEGHSESSPTDQYKDDSLGILIEYMASNKYVRVITFYKPVQGLANHP